MRRKEKQPRRASRDGAKMFMTTIKAFEEFYEALSDKEKDRLAAAVLGNLTADQIVEKLDTKNRDTVFRMLWAEHVREDVLSYLSIPKESHLLYQYGVDFDNSSIAEIANRYVNGEYDCNCSYWENLDALIEEVIGKRTKEQESEAERE